MTPDEAERARQALLSLADAHISLGAAYRLVGDAHLKVAHSIRLVAVALSEPAVAPAGDHPKPGPRPGPLGSGLTYGGEPR